MLPRCPTKSPCQSAVISCHGKKYLTATHFLLVVTFSLLLSSCSHCNISLLKNQGGKKNIYFSILKYYYRKTAPEFFWYAFQCSRLNHSSCLYNTPKYKTCLVLLDTFSKNPPFTPVKSPYIYAQKIRPPILSHIYRHIYAPQVTRPRPCYAPVYPCYTPA